MRRLELYYNENSRVFRSVLRDISAISDLSQIDTRCDLASHCFETRYGYNEFGYLTTVTYADGNVATYEYDANGKMSRHDDPRAPVSPVMTYNYGDDGVFQSTLSRLMIPVLPWRQLDTPNDNVRAARRSVNVTDEYGNQRSYTFAWTQGSLKSAGDNFTLLSETSPLDGFPPFESIPLEYTWENGLLTRRLPRVNRDTGRNSAIYEFTGAAYPTSTTARASATYRGQISADCIRHHFLPKPFNLLTIRRYPYYDERGWIESVIDRNGEFSYTWNGFTMIT
jgi:YD repeat-containing protein